MNCRPTNFNLQIYFSKIMVTDFQIFLFDFMTFFQKIALKDCFDKIKLNVFSAIFEIENKIFYSTFDLLKKVTIF